MKARVKFDHATSEAIWYKLQIKRHKWGFWRTECTHYSKSRLEERAKELETLE